MIQRSPLAGKTLPAICDRLPLSDKPYNTLQENACTAL